MSRDSPWNDRVSVKSIAFPSPPLALLAHSVPLSSPALCPSVLSKIKPTPILPWCHRPHGVPGATPEDTVHITVSMDITWHDHLLGGLNGPVSEGQRERCSLAIVARRRRLDEAVWFAGSCTAQPVDPHSCQGTPNPCFLYGNMLCFSFSFLKGGVVLTCLNCWFRTWPSLCPSVSRAAQTWLAAPERGDNQSSNVDPVTGRVPDSHQPPFPHLERLAIQPDRVAIRIKFINPR